MTDLVKNAADPKQVKNAGRKERDRRGRELADLRQVLTTIEGRRTLWRIMAWTNYLENPTHARGDMTHQNIGRADAGRFILSEIMESNDDAFFLMMQEARARERSDKVEAEALHTRSAESQQQEEQHNA